MPIDTLNTAWFALIGVLWAGYFVLEGFDFGVGILTPLLAHDDLDRRLCINTIGPVWDGNEVWLIVAGGATFAAFPDWYATMFSGFYLALFLILAGLIVRGVSFEFRGKDRAPAWRATWDRALFVGSLIPALLWGVAFTNLIHGLDIGAGFHYLGGFAGLIHPMAVLGGLAGLSLFVLHGAVFLAAKTGGDLSERARRAARLMVVPTVALLGGLIAWVALAAGPRAAQTLPRVVPLIFAAVAVALVMLTRWMVGLRRDLMAFAATAGAILCLTAAAFTALFPRVMVSTRPAFSLTIWNAASAHNTLVVMTVVAAIFTPFVLAYQAWSYLVFRQRLTRPPQSTPSGLGGPSSPVPEQPTPARPAPRPVGGDS